MAKRMGRRPTMKTAPSGTGFSTAEEARSIVQRPVQADVLDISRKHIGRITGGYTIIDAFGKSVTALYELARGKGRPSFLYDNELQRIYRPGEEPKPPPAAKAAADKIAGPPLDEDPEDLDADDDPGMVLPVADDDDGEVEGVNLTAWAGGHVNYRFALVREAIQERYGRVVDHEGDAADFLLEQGMKVSDARLAKRRTAVT